MRRDALLAIAAFLVGCNNSTPASPSATAAQPPREPTSAPPPAPPTASAGGPSASDAGGDPIGARIAQFDEHGLWSNGLAPTIRLPATASSELVLAEMFAKVGFDRGHVKTHRVLESREVQIGKDPLRYRALLVQTDLGRKVVLVRYESDSGGWWTRAYDAD